MASPYSTAIERVKSFTDEPSAKLDSILHRIETDEFFKTFAPSVRRILNALQFVGSCNEDLVSAQQGNAMVRPISSALDQLDRLIGYSARNAAPPNLEETLDNVWRTLVDEVLIKLVAITFSSPNVIGDEANRRLQGAKSTETEIGQIKTQVEKILEDAQRAAGKLGVSQQALHFKKLADGYEHASHQWAKVTVGLGVVGLLPLA